MKDIVQDRLSKMEDLEQRKMLKNIVTSVFLNLVEYQEEMNRKLEERVFNEIEDLGERHDIYVTMCAREDIDPIHEFLYPMIPSDAEKKMCDMKSLLAKLSQREEACLLTLFLECDYATLKQLIYSRRTFTGEIVTASGNHRIEVRLAQNPTYMAEIEKLYHVFQKNNLPWKTVNNPYAYKFFDVMLIACDSTLSEEEEILEISINLEQYEPYKQLDKVPLWNIKRLELRNAGFPIPAKDRVNFEHVLSLVLTGTEHGYLVDGDESMMRYIKRTPEELTIVTPEEKSSLWNVLQIIQPVSSKIHKLEYELVSNKKKSSFTDRFAHKQALTVRAKGEIVRIVNSFESSKFVDLEQVIILESSDGEEATYGMNPFISDNVRMESDKKVMRLRFRIPESSQFIIHDILSFIVSEVQMYFPEYKCEGEWA
ncbi:normocyte-binding protein [Paenibacillus sp. 481]|uniref:normocyte-binding protein n=1 Tax=Paenibacillus sp. 481 TaxID=2835869 RepID=UPI001E5DAA63|nr:normocyte-binding protein [Paenibacillus sp. 481]UHA72254.1 normocyte-binding protein [Paenibacillus sp. 481]